MQNSGCLILIVILLANFVGKTVAQFDCQPTITTVEGPIAPNGPLCSGQLIFDEQFDELDTNVWKHENRMSAVWVLIFENKYILIFNYKTFFFVRTVNSSGTRKAFETHSLKMAYCIFNQPSLPMRFPI